MSHISLRGSIRCWVKTVLLQAFWDSGDKRTIDVLLEVGTAFKGLCFDCAMRNIMVEGLILRAGPLSRGAEAIASLIVGHLESRAQGPVRDPDSEFGQKRYLCRRRAEEAGDSPRILCAIKTVNVKEESIVRAGLSSSGAALRWKKWWPCADYSTYLTLGRVAIQVPFNGTPHFPRACQCAIFGPTLWLKSRA